MSGYDMGHGNRRVRPRAGKPQGPRPRVRLAVARARRLEAGDVFRGERRLSGPRAGSVYDMRRTGAPKRIDGLIYDPSQGLSGLGKFSLKRALHIPKARFKGLGKTLAIVGGTVAAVALAPAALPFLARGAGSVGRGIFSAGRAIGRAAGGILHPTSSPQPSDAPYGPPAPQDLPPGSPPGPFQLPTGSAPTSSTPGGSGDYSGSYGGGGGYGGGGASPAGDSTPATPAAAGLGGNNVLLVGAGLAALLLLPKILKPARGR